MDEVHTFDPNGDVLLHLQKKTPVEAGETMSAPGDPIVQLSTDKESIATLPVEHAHDEQSPGAQSPTQSKEDGLFERGTAYLQDGEGSALDSTHTVYFRVSSSHLILASTMFRNMLCSDTYSEGQTLRSQGNLVLELPDDPEDLAILMNIIHGKTRDVPRIVSLDLLANLANLINYYSVHEAVELFVETWLADLMRKTTRVNYDPKVTLRWLFISWVFQKKEEFEKMTRILILESNDRFQDDIDYENIPIPASIINRILEHRIEAIAQTIVLVDTYIAKYSTPDTICKHSDSFACDSGVLGSLIKGSAKIGISPPREAPYPGMTFIDLATKVRKMQICEDNHRDNYRNQYYSHHNGHGIKQHIEASIRSLEDQFCGLKLDSFLLEAQDKNKDKIK